MGECTKSDDGGVCRGCNYKLAPGTDTCHVCGRVEPRRGDPYPVGKVERHDWVDAQPVGNASAKAVLGALIRHDRPWGTSPGTVWPGVERLVQITELSRATVFRALGYLEDAGWITVKRASDARTGFRAANRYTIHHPHSGANVSL